MPFVFLGLSILGSTLMWPLNRWLTRSGGVARIYGFWIGVSGTVVSGLLCLVTGQGLSDPLIWLLGGIVGVAFAFGYCVALMRCVQIGPLGPSAAVNNMGLLWPVLLGAVWLDPHVLHLLPLAGFALIVVAIVLFGMSPSQASAGGTARVSLRWGMWALLTWISAGVSMTAQLAASLWAPGEQFPLLFAFMSVTVAIFFPVVLRKGKRMFGRTEVLAGLGNGSLQVLSISTMFLALRTFKSEVVFPYTIGTPVILAIVLGALVYRDKIGKVSAVATALGVAGLLALSLP